MPGERGLQGDAVQVEQVTPRRPARRLAREHAVGREERGEHHDVAEQEDPEPVGDDDAFRRRPAFAVTGRLAVAVPADLAHEAETVGVRRPGSRGDVAGEGRGRRSCHGLLRLLPLFQPGLARGAPRPVDPGDFVRRDLVFLDVAPGEDHEGRVGADQGHADQPPDVPDQREARQRREERAR